MSVRQRLATKRKNARNMPLTDETESSSTNEPTPVPSKRQKKVTEKRLRRYRAVHGNRE